MALDDLFGIEVDFQEGERLVLVHPIPDANEERIQVGDVGTFRRGFAGMPCVYFDRDPSMGQGMVRRDGKDIWIVTLCERVTS